MTDVQKIFEIATRLAALTGYDNLRRRNVRAELLRELVSASPRPVGLPRPLGIALAGEPTRYPADPDWEDILQTLA